MLSTRSLINVLGKALIEGQEERNEVLLQMDGIQAQLRPIMEKKNTQWYCIYNEKIKMINQSWKIKIHNGIVFIMKKQK